MKPEVRGEKRERRRKIVVGFASSVFR